jgi:hypothetical protein
LVTPFEEVVLWQILCCRALRYAAFNGVVKLVRLHGL